MSKPSGGSQTDWLRICSLFEEAVAEPKPHLLAATDPKFDAQRFGQILQAVRIAASMVPIEVERAVGVESKRLGDWEAGNSRPGIERLSALLTAYRSKSGVTLGPKSLEAEIIAACGALNSRASGPFDHFSRDVNRRLAVLVVELDNDLGSRPSGSRLERVASSPENDFQRLAQLFQALRGIAEMQASDVLIATESSTFAVRRVWEWETGTSIPKPGNLRRLLGVYREKAGDGFGPSDLEDQVGVVARAVAQRQPEPFGHLSGDVRIFVDSAIMRLRRTTEVQLGRGGVRRDGELEL